MVLPSLSASEFLEGVGCICLRSDEGLPANGDAFGLITLCSSAKLKSPSVQFSASSPTSVMSMLCTLFFDLLHFMMARRPGSGCRRFEQIGGSLVVCTG